MRTEKWNMYIETLQGHPSVCQSSHTIEGMKFITELIPPDKFPRLLNIGVGEGLETDILNKLGYKYVVGVIRGESNLRFALEHYNSPNVTFIGPDSEMHDLPFPSNSFDAVYMKEVFEHSYAPMIFLLELYCVLRVGGRMWISMPDFKEITDPTIGDTSKIGHHHPNIICRNLLTQFFQSSGFKILNDLNQQNPSQNNYLLEKQPIEFLHSDVKTVIEKRKKIFG